MDREEYMAEVESRVSRGVAYLDEIMPAARPAVMVGLLMGADIPVHVIQAIGGTK